MCGLLFHITSNEPLPECRFLAHLLKMQWRGPDAQAIHSENQGHVRFGHCRLSIIDPTPRSNQPMLSHDGRFIIVFNGEIYNHLALRESLSLTCSTGSDTETILEGFTKLGDRIFELLNGMFSLVIYDKITGKWVAARDAFGIKPLYIHTDARQTIIASEAAIIADMINAPLSEESLSEWRLIRRPLPGHSFFHGIDEIEPGTSLNSDGYVKRHWQWIASDEPFAQTRFEQLLGNSVKEHELSDVGNVALLSGGLDSAIITALSKVSHCYTVGLPTNNEFEGAAETASHLGKHLTKVKINNEDLSDTWRSLTRLRGEPLGLPNEGLIYRVCTSMQPHEKVVLTGEGADELLFGYDNLFRWSSQKKQIDTATFIRLYGYSDTSITERLLDYIENLKANRQPVEFMEDFFYQLHLPGLLRRMDFASMAASKEARVPFVNKSLIQYMYRRPSALRIDNTYSKIPLRALAEKLGLAGALGRKKIGFSAQTDTAASRTQDYAKFQQIVLEAL